MSSSVTIDDTSLLLLILIVTLLLISAISSRWYQPALHPLILARQADTSQVHNKDESPVYRNVNAPHSFDLASKPAKNIHDVRSLIQSPSTQKRTVYHAQKSNEDLVTEAEKFARGVTALVSSSSSLLSAGPPSLGVVFEVDTWQSLVATLAASITPAAHLSTVVIPPLHLPEAEPAQLPQSAQRLSAVFTTPQAIHKAANMPIVNENTLFILENQEQASLAQRNLPDRKLNIVTFSDVLEKGGHESAGNDDNNTASASSIVASFWIGSQWTQVTQRAITAGVTTYMSFYPPDKIPTASDTIYIEQSPFASSPSLHLGAAATPAGLTLALTALYTSSSITTGPLTTSLSDPNPSTHSSLAKSNATILYTSPAGAASLGLALTSLSKKSPFGSMLYAGKLRTLRQGSLSSDSIYDSLLFSSVRRSLGLQNLRAVNILGQGWVVPQRLLDVLRSHTGVPVMNAFLPSAPLRVLPSSGESQTQTRNLTAWTTAPVACSHAYDLQAFKANNNLSEMPAHVGPPAVSVELKVQREPSGPSSNNATSSQTPHGWQRFSTKDDFIGALLVRGNILTTGTEEQQQQEWYNVPYADDTDDNSSAAQALFRSNGTLFLLPPSIHAEKKQMVPIPTMSAKYPIKGSNKIGAGADDDVADQERAQSKKDV